MGTTSNGRPWGENVGRLGGGIAYGYAAKKGIEAAQRRGTEEGDGDWTTPAVAANVGLQWVLFIALTIIQAWWITNATVMIVTGFFDPNRPHTDGWTVATGVLAITCSVLAISATRAKLRRAEGLPPKRSDRYLTWRYFPKGWFTLYLVPTFSYYPFYLALR